jgi:hypothetical protein
MESAEVDDALLHHNIGVAMQRVPIPNVTNRLNMLHDTVPRAVIEVASELAQLPPLCVVHLRPVVVADGVRVFMVVIEWRFVKSCSSMLWLHYSTLSLFVGIGNHGIVSWWQSWRVELNGVRVVVFLVVKVGRFVSKMRVLNMTVAVATLDFPWGRKRSEETIWTARKGDARKGWIPVEMAAVEHGCEVGQQWWHFAALWVPRAQAPIALLLLFSLLSTGWPFVQRLDINGARQEKQDKTTHKIYDKKTQQHNTTQRNTRRGNEKGKKNSSTHAFNLLLLSLNIFVRGLWGGMRWMVWNT